MPFELTFTKKLLNDVFPFHILVDRSMCIKEAGKSIHKLFPEINGKLFQNIFVVKRPAHASNEFDSLKEFLGQIFILETVEHRKRLMFRYEMIFLQEVNCLLFLGSPWITDTKDLNKMGIKLKDFALHDSMTDLLQVLTVKEINNREIIELNKKLESSEIRYRQIVESTNDLIYYTDIHGNLTYVNPTVLKRLGVEEPDIIGHNFLVFVPDEYKSEVRDFYNQVRTDKVSNSYNELPILTKDDEVVWIGQNVSANFDPNGLILSFHAVARDITKRIAVERELRSTELRLRSLIQNLQSGILVEDEDRKIVLSNGYFCDIFQINQDPGDLVGQDCSMSAEYSKHLFKNPEKFVNGIKDVLMRRQVEIGQELELADGRIFERDYIPIFLKGTYKGHLWQYKDITDRKKAESEIIKARLEAEDARRAEENFLAQMSHEIRTPLNAVVGMGHLLKETEMNVEQQEYLDILHESAEILQNLISDVLDLSQISSGKINIREESFDLVKNLEGLMASFKHRALEKRILINLIIDDNVKTKVIGDKLLLNQVLMNLLSNALKFTNEGYINLRLEADEIIKQEINITFYVEDSGIGIAKDNINKIFSQFTQAKEDIKMMYGGSGLGLYIVHQLVILLGGRVNVDSEVGQGSIFKVRLPFKIDNSEISKVEEEDSKHDLEGIKILVAEDHHMNQVLISKLLDKWQATYKIVDNGHGVLDELGQNAYDLLLLDLQMPEMDGFETAKKIQELEKAKVREIPVIALTAAALTEYRDKSIELGFKDFVSKPFKPEKLKKKILAQIGNSSNRISDALCEIPFDKQLDIEYLNEFYHGDLEFAFEMFELFINNAYPEFLAISEVINLGRTEEANRIIHKLVPSFSMVGLTDVTSELEILDRNLSKYDIVEALDKFSRVQKKVDLLYPVVEGTYYKIINMKYRNGD